MVWVLATVWEMNVAVKELRGIWKGSRHVPWEPCDTSQGQSVLPADGRQQHPGPGRAPLRVPQNLQKSPEEAQCGAAGQLLF